MMSGAPQTDEFSQRLAAALGSTAPGAAGPEPHDAPAGAADAGAASQPPPPTQPVGEGEYVVKPGDCMSSIARSTGHFWETLWNDPHNAELRQVRQDPNVLLPKDRVHIREIIPKSEPGATELRHRFVRRGEPSKLKMQLKSGGKPRANQPYRLIIDGRDEITGVTDAEGKLEIAIPGNAKRGELFVGEEPNVKKYELKLGDLDPVESITGFKARLNNLGFGCGAVNDRWDEKAAAATRRFQAQHQLEQTGLNDQATQQKLKDVHGY